MITDGVRIKFVSHPCLSLPISIIAGKSAPEVLAMHFHDHVQFWIVNSQQLAAGDLHCPHEPFGKLIGG